MGLKRHGGASGLGDIGLFESVIMQPENDFYYGKVDVFGISASYAYHISQAQSFLDGNKRTAVSSALVFLELN